jgi:hypothetical protein
MSGQLFSGLGLAAAAAGAAVAGVTWLAAAAVVAAIPFIVVGVLLELGRPRAQGSSRRGWLVDV